MPTIHVAHSPDSDDAFMFWALATDQFDTEDRKYIHELSDIESLNQRALKAELEVTAVSVHAYTRLADTYAILPHGASMGDREYGPRLVSLNAKPEDVKAGMRGKRIAVPGELTTAYLVLKLFEPDFEPVVIPFDQIEDAVVRGEVELGLLIHEGQLTYQDKGLHLWLDEGAWWYDQTGGLPLPLGCNVVRRDLGEDFIKKVSRDLRKSITLGLEHRDEALKYALQYSRGLSDDQADKFVGMYVNELTVDYGERGRKAVAELLNRSADAGLIPADVPIDFIDDSE
ncbi:MAG: ABC transporter substrate-binding protein [Gemmatimonadota bacterium]|nr:ABC transporter substrate-binding protein [Gemmatimonadota bacterium]MDH5803913.1 ABC transporter substrate-binding protein [Gemmatimonadota bacterium]